MTAYLKVLSALGPRVKRKQGNGIQANCPVHIDDKASLHVTNADGVALMKCFAGCETEDIVKAINLKWTDLFPEKETNDKIQISEIYPYQDEQGKILYEVLRLIPKSFRQRVPDGSSYRWTLSGIRRVLYRLPALLAQPTRAIWIVEGEKDANNLAALGMLSTTSAGGASGWRKELIEPLRGRHVMVVPDNDEPGFAYAEAISQSLHGVAASVRIVTLPGLKPKEDVSDWLVKGGTRADLEALAKSTSPESEPLTLISLLRKVEKLQAEVDKLKETK